VLVEIRPRTANTQAGGGCRGRQAREGQALWRHSHDQLDDLLSKEIALDEINEGYEALHDSSITRVVITAGLN